MRFAILCMHGATAGISEIEKENETRTGSKVVTRELGGGRRARTGGTGDRTGWPLGPPAPYSFTT